jgi:hypothetical protein
MAKKITQEQVVQTDLWENTIKSTTALLGLIDDLNTQLSKTAKISQDALSNNKADNFDGLKEANEEVERLNKAYQDKLKLDKQRVALQNKLNAIEAESSKNLSELEVKTKKLLSAKNQLIKRQVESDKQRRAGNKEKADAIKLTKEEEKELSDLTQKLTVANLRKAEATKLNKQQIKGSIGLTSAYSKESKRLNDLRNKYKDLALAEKENTKEGKKLLSQITKLDSKLKRIDKTVGQSQRNVGNYTSAFKKLATSFKNIALGLGVVQVIRGIGRVISDAARRVVEFDKELQNIAGITGSTRSSLKDLEESIVSVSKSSIRTSVEVAKLATTLFTLGKTKEEVKLLLKPVNDLSIAFGVNADAAADFLGQTLNAFGKGAEFASKFADIIANVRTSTSLDFERIKDGLGFIAPTANALNLTLGETTALLGVLQDNGVRAARAGRLLNSSFARILDKGLTLEDALEKINKSQNRITTSSELFGKEALSLGLILADNTEKTADLANEFDNLSSGSLDELTSRQLDSLSAKLTILDSSWEALILSIENGTGGLSIFFKDVIVGVTNVFNILRRYNQTFQQNLKEDVEESNKDFIKILQKYTDINVASEKRKYEEALELAEGNLEEQKRLTIEYNTFLEGANEEQKARRKKDRDAEIDAETKRYADREINLDQYNKKVKEIEEKYIKSIEGARNASYRKKRDELKQSVAEEAAELGIAAADVEKELERIDEKAKAIKPANILVVETAQDAAKNAQERARVKTEKAALRRNEKALINIVEQKDQIKQINILLKQTEEIKPPLLLTTEGAGKTKVVVGLINKQAAEVQRLTEAVNAAKIEADDPKSIFNLGEKLKVAQDELKRLNRIFQSTFEEIDQIERDLISDENERAIANEIEKSEKIIEQLTTNAKLAQRELIKIPEGASKFEIAQINEKNEKILFLNKKFNLENQTLNAENAEKLRRLIEAENKRLAAFINKEEIKKRNKQIEDAVALEKAQFNQKRGNFKTEEKFLKEQKRIFDQIEVEALDKRIEVLKQFGDESSKIEIEQLKAKIETYTKFVGERVKLEIDVITLLEELNEKYFSEQLDRVDRQISDLEKRERNLQDLANRGQQEASDSLAENQKNQAEAAKKREDLLQKEKQFELALAIIASYRAELKREPTPTTGEALANTIASTSVLTSIVQAIPLFDGTEDTGNGGNVDGRGGFHAILHPNERVISKKENMKMGGISNEDAANIVHDFNNDLLSYNTPQLTVQKSNWDSNEQVLQKFDELKKDIVGAINNKETYLGSDIDTMKKIILQSYQKGSTRTTVKSKYPTRR